MGQQVLLVLKLLALTVVCLVLSLKDEGRQWIIAKEYLYCPYFMVNTYLSMILSYQARTYSVQWVLSHLILFEL